MDASAAEPLLNIAFVRATLTTFLGAGLALAATLLVRWWVSKNERATRVRRRSELAQTLIGAIQKNGPIVERLGRQTPDTHILGFVDTAALDATASLKYDLIDAVELNARVDDLRDVLAEILRLQRLYIALSYGPNMTHLPTLKTLLTDELSKNATKFARTMGASKVIERLGQYCS